MRNSQGRFLSKRSESLTHRPAARISWLAGLVAHQPQLVHQTAQRLLVQAGARTRSKPQSLSDLITFESQVTSGGSKTDEDAASRADAIIRKAASLLESVQELTSELDADPAPKASTSGRAAAAIVEPEQRRQDARSSQPSSAASSSGSSSGSSSTSRDGAAGGAKDVLQQLGLQSEATRSVLANALEKGPGSGSRSGSSLGSGGSLDFGGDSGSSSGSSLKSPAWLDQAFGSTSSASSSNGSSSSGGFQLQLQSEESMDASPWSRSRAFEFADMELPTGFLELQSEESMLADEMRYRELPPLQSILELTTAFRPPTRTGEEVEVDVDAPKVVGRLMEDGSGVLPDGTKWEKTSGVDTGPNGYQKKWTIIKGSSHMGKVNFEEKVWTASDRTGLREMGAQKSGNRLDGSAWREEWTENMAHAGNSLRMVIERTAHKWASDAGGDEWEEKWGEKYEEGGRVNKFADKWAKAGPQVWHEKWGEDYSGNGDDCVKYTDKWAERRTPDGGTEQWGDKWTESFGAGKGTKHGEVWSLASDGNRYNRWWNEEHLGGGTVRMYGNGTAGEDWDYVQQMDTYYNPIPHFGYKLALEHSPQLASVPLPPIEDLGGEDTDGLGEGLDGF